MIFTCGLCGDVTDDLMSHLRLTHPDKYDQMPSAVEDDAG